MKHVKKFDSKINEDNSESLTPVKKQNRIKFICDNISKLNDDEIMYIYNHIESKLKVQFKDEFRRGRKFNFTTLDSKISGEYEVISVIGNSVNLLDRFGKNRKFSYDYLYDVNHDIEFLD